MASSSDTPYTARFALPELIERGTANTLRCPVYDDGVLSAPSSGTVSVYEGSIARVDAQSVTVTSSVATYSWTPATTIGLGEGWRVEWALVMPDGKTHTYRNEAALVRRRLYCPITNADLYDLVPALDPASPSPITSLTAAQISSRIEQAWEELQRRLLAKGNRPNLVVNAYAFTTAMVELSLARLFEGLPTHMNQVWAQRGAAHRARYEAAWLDVSLLYAEGDTETADPRRRRGAGVATLWMGGFG